MPGSVSVTERVVRLRRRMPTCFSRSAMCRDTSAREIDSDRAAVAKLPQRATAVNLVTMVSILQQWVQDTPGRRPVPCGAIGRGDIPVKWCRFTHAGTARLGLIEGERVRAAEGSLFDGARVTGETYALADVRLLPPTLPFTFFAVGFNYRAHVLHSQAKGSAV